MPPMPILGLLMVIIPFAFAVREEGELEEALSGLGMSADTHVCCVMFQKSKSGEIISTSTDVYNQRFQKEIKKCDLTYITSDACKNDAQCKKECDAKLAESVRYHKVVDAIAIKKEQERRKSLERMKADGEKRGNQTLQDLDAQYRKEMQEAEQAVVKAQTAVATAEGEQKEMEIELERLKAKLAAMPAKIHELTVIYDKTKENFYKAKQTALDNYEKGKAATEAATQANAADVDAKLKEQAEQEAKRAESEKSHKDSPVPSACFGDMVKNGKWAAVDCCCSINGIPMLVDYHFADWGTCMAPQKYQAPMISYYRCNLFQECAKCREQVCKKGMCPVEE